jgi:polyhydroxyalkanoate synthesis regulator phasin
MPQTGSSPRRRRRVPAKTAGDPLREEAQAVERPAADEAASTAGGLASLAEDVINRLLARFDAVLLSRERIQATLDDAAERGRVTRTDANELVSELVRRGRQQTDDFLGELRSMLGRGREQLESTTRRARRSEPVDRLVRSADRARRVVGVGSSFPITGYDELTVAQVSQRLAGLTPAELRQVADYERRHANRKSVLARIERLLD